MIERPDRSPPESGSTRGGHRMDGRRSRLWRIRAGLALLLGLSGLASPVRAGSVDPDRWVESDLVQQRDGRLVYDHHSLCAMRDALAKPSERALVHVRAGAPVEAISRDQLVALVVRLEAVTLMGIGERWRPGTSALRMSQILDCRPRVGVTEEAVLEVSIVVEASGFEATFDDRLAGTVSKHAETWSEAFRP